MKRAINTYKGISKDVSYDSIRDGFYIDAINMRITTTSGESNTSVTNFKGTEFYLIIPQDNVTSGVKEIIGVTYIRNRIILFCTDDSDTNGWIYVIEYDETDGSLGSIIEKYYSTELFFSKLYPIEALGRYESDCIQRVYWTDYNNYFRSVNLEDPNLATTPVGLIDIFPDISYVFPKLINVLGGGALLAGTWTYSYRLISFDGKETLISPEGNLIHTTRDFESTPTPPYTGSIEGTVTNKAHEISIDTSNYLSFEKIELIAAHYANFTASPTIYIVERKLIGANTTITFIHNGNEENIEELDFVEFSAKQYPFKTFKTLAAKDNSLIPANVKGTNFVLSDVLDPGEEFDARTARYNSSGVKPHPETGTPEEIDEDKYKNAFNTDVDSGLHPTITYPERGYNNDEHWEAEWHDLKQFKFQQGGTRLGGEGPNISYTFHLEDFYLDGNNIAAGEVNLPALGGFTGVNLNDGHGTYINTAYDDMASPFRSGLLRGYKRGETYRFGIVFYDNKGETSFVQYIGDIKFPDLSEEDSVTTASLNGNSVNYFPISAKDETPGDKHVRGFSLGISFEIDLSSCPSLLNKVSGFQIVRTKRDVGDSRRLCTGVMRNMMKFNINRDPGSRSSTPDIDLGTPNNSDNILHLYQHTMYWWSEGNMGNISAAPPPSTGPEIPYTVKLTGANSNFFALNDEFNDSSSFNDFPIYGSALTFYSPELSYNFPGIRSSAGVPSQSLLLMTGRYKCYLSNHDPFLTYSEGSNNNVPFPQGSETFKIPYGPLAGTSIHNTIDLEYYRRAIIEDTTDNGDFGTNIYDYRRSLKTTGKIDKSTTIKAIECVKQWYQTEFIDFAFNSGNNDDTSLGFGLTSYQGWGANGTSIENNYIRNYYAYLDNHKIGLNDHDPFENVNGSAQFLIPGGITGLAQPSSHYVGAGPGNLAVSASLFTGLWKGATGLTGTIRYPLTNPYNQSQFITYPPGFSGKNYFAAYSGGTWNHVDVDWFSGDLCNTNEPNIGEARASSTPILDLLVPRSEIYGGFNVDALESNIFIPASPILDISLIDGTTYQTINPIKVYGGDIFITPFVWQDMSVFINQNFYQNVKNSSNTNSGANPAQAFDKNAASTTVLMIESRINCELAHGATLNRGVQKSAPGGPSGQLNTLWRQEAGNTVVEQALVNDMYVGAYNEAYSRDKDAVIFTTKPEAFDVDCNKNDIRAFISEVKTNEEEIDSWTKFAVNNAYDVDDYGPINKVLNHKDEVYFVQDKAIGRYSINPRAITSTDDGIPTELGTAEGFQDHKYLSTQHGSIHQWAVKQTDLGIYFFDAIHRKIFQIGAEAISPLSELKGIHSLLSNFEGDVFAQKFEIDGNTPKGDNPILRKGVHIGKDLINNEVFFTFRGLTNFKELVSNENYEVGDIVFYNDNYFEVHTAFSTEGILDEGELAIVLGLNSDFYTGKIQNLINDYTIVYDELAQQFSSEYSTTPSIYIENGDILLSPRQDNPTQLWRHNTGDYGNTYGLIREASISLVINEAPDINKILRFVEFNSIVRDNNKNIDRTKTITAFKVDTEYQSTGKINATSGRIKRRFDKWRLKLPRNQNGTKNDRLRSSHFILTLYFDNTENKELILNRVHSYFDVQVF